MEPIYDVTIGSTSRDSTSREGPYSSTLLSLDRGSWFVVRGSVRAKLGSPSMFLHDKAQGSSRVVDALQPARRHGYALQISVVTVARPSLRPLKFRL